MSEIQNSQKVATFKQRAEKAYGSRFSYEFSTFTGLSGVVNVGCTEHGVFSTRVQDFLNGHSCPECGRAAARAKHMAKAADRLAGLKELFPEYKFPDYVENYQGVLEKVKVICHVHGEFLASTHHLQKGKGCRLCGLEKSAEARKLNFSHFLKTAKEVHGDKYTYDEGAYLGWRLPTSISCVNHGSFEVTPEAHVKLERGCRTCLLTQRIGKFVKPATEFEEAAKAVHGGLYTYCGDYSGALDTVTAICAKHGEFKQQAYVHLRGSGCQQCAAEVCRLASIVSFEEFQERAVAIHGDNYNYDASSYTKMSEVTDIVCKKHGLLTQMASAHVHQNKPSRCPKCAITNSRGQEELTGYIRRLGFEVVSDYRYSEGKRSIDVYIPELKLGVEFDGTYFHSSKFRKSSDMNNKRAECKVAGINLVNIFSDEWEHRQAQVKNLLASRLGRLTHKVYARKCEVVQLSNAEASDFHEKNHIQVFKLTGISFGLKAGTELVAVMTFTQRMSNRKRSVKGIYELARYSSRVQVLGGASRLLKSALNQLQAKSVISYSDNRLFTGGMYEVLGFKKVKVTSPSYTYITEGCGDRKGKSNFTRDRLAKKFPERFDAKLSERENCEALGLYQVYDCGLTVWNLNLE